MNKKVYIRDYKSAKKVCIDAKKVCIDAKKVYIIAEKVYIDTKKGLHFCTIGLQHLSKNDKKVYQMQTSVNQCKPFQRFTSICPPMKRLPAGMLHCIHPHSIPPEKFYIIRTSLYIECILKIQGLRPFMYNSITLSQGHIRYTMMFMVYTMMFMVYTMYIYIYRCILVYS